MQANDREAIADLAKHYARCVDLRDFTLLPSLFMPAAKIIVGSANAAGAHEVWYRMDGIDQISAGLRQIVIYPITFHCLGQQLVLESDADSARTETYCTAYHYYQKDNAEIEYIMFIRYVDDLVRNSGRWQFGQRRLLVQHTRGIPAA
ncbi:MAG TPA: nuclear transport factor 2 family protein [Spongiibacteraceae bacterium]